MGRRVRKFDGPCGPEGCGIALAGDEYEVSVTGFTFSVVRYNKHYDNQPPPVAFPPFGALRHHLPAPLGSVSLATAERWDYKALKSSARFVSGLHF